MAFKKLSSVNGYEDILVNTDDISSCHVEGGFSYTDYVLTLKNGTKYYLKRDSYYKVLELAEQE